ncbi:hypothetical protein BSF_29760 [Bacillus subtilis]|nr:hypothetical protein BSF_29760 [Bacillus subtilis]
MIPDFSKYPICDTNIWINLCFGDALNYITKKHPILLFADVVENEIMKFKSNKKFSRIATDFEVYKNQGVFFVIEHEKHIEPEIQEMMENSLYELGFEYGLDKLEKDKGEFVSALYADEFNIPFMKTNDGTFRTGNRGNNEFPDLYIKDWYAITEEYIENLNERIRVRKLVDAERARLRLSKQKHEESKEKSKKVDPLGQLAQFFNAKRL